MDLENPLAIPRQMMSLLNSPDNSPDTNPEQSLVNISIIKHELLDVTDSDSNEESADVNLQKLADKTINERPAEIEENGDVDPALDSLTPEYNSEGILEEDAPSAHTNNSYQNLDYENTKTTNIHVISNVLINSVDDYVEVSNDNENSHVSDPLKINPPDDSSGNFLLLEDNTYSCSLCSFTTDRRLRLNDHERNHRKNNQPIFQCFYCSQRYTRVLLHLHIQNVHPGQKFQIRDENLIEANRATSFDSSETHLPTSKDTERSSETDANRLQDTQSGSSLVKASKEKGTFKTSLKYKTYSVSKTDKLKLKFHKGKGLKHNAEALTDSKGHRIYKCKMCSYTQRKLVSIVGHIASHKYLPIMNCPKCDFKSTQRVMNFHLPKCKESLNVDTTAKMSPKALGDDDEPSKVPRKCSSCSFSTFDDLKLKIHMKKHMYEPDVGTNSAGRKIYKCRMCSYTQKKFVAMAGHMASHKYLSIVNCPNCDFKSTQRAVKHHQRNCQQIPKQTDSAEETQDKSDDKRCSSCSFTTSDDITLKAHMKDHLFEPDITTSSGYKSYRCKMCSYDSKDIIAIAGHINSHKNNLPIEQCPNCDFKSTFRVMVFHRRKCKEVVEESVSEGKTTSGDKIDQRSVGSSKNNEISSQTLLKCTTCPFSTSDDLKLKMHKKKHFFEPDILTDSYGRKIYHCRMCSYTQIKFVSMVGHIKAHKNILYNVKCPNCDFQSMPLTVKHHMRKCQVSLQSSLQSTNEEIPNKVDIAHDLVESSESNEVASNTFPTRSTRSCSISDGLKLKVHKKNRLVEHKVLRDSSGKKLFCCKKCSYVCNKLIQISSHINTHNTSLPIIKCPNCDFKSTNIVMRFHRRKCTGSLLSNSGVEADQSLIKPSGISEDSSKIPNKRSIVTLQSTNHLGPAVSVNSLGYKLFQCKMCSYTGTSQRMGFHVNVHKNNLFIIKCSLCNYRSTSRLLRIHMKNIHSTTRVTFGCEHCSFVTSNTDHYNKHMKKHNFKSTGNNLGTHTAKCDSNEKVSSEGFVTARSSRKIYSCKLCPFNTIKHQTYASHIRYHSSKHQRKSKSINSALVKDDNASRVSNRATKQLKTDQTKNKPIKVHKCRLCSFVTSRGTSFASHMKSHDQKQPIKKCRSCKFKSTPNCLAKHMSIQCHYGETRCRVCSLVCRSANNLKMHMMSHSSKLPITKCTHCSFRSTAQCLKAHIQKCHSVCDKDSDEVSEHGSIENINENDSKDAKEDISSKKDGETIETYEISKPSTEKSSFQCSQCSFSTYLRIKLKLHMRKYHSEQSRHDEASESLTGSSVTKSEALYNCGDCTYVTKVKTHYLRHVRTHLYPKRLTYIQCRKCDYRSTRYDIKVHSRTCQGNRQPKLKCTACSYSSNQKNNLKHHLEKQHYDDLKGQDMFVARECTICDYVTLFKRKFAKHEKQHEMSDDLESDDKLTNDQIEPTFRNAKRRRRIRASDDQAVYKCTSCDFSSKYKWSLIRHIEGKHVDPSESRQKQSKVEDAHDSEDESSSDANLQPSNSMPYVEDQFEPGAKQSEEGSIKRRHGKDHEKSPRIARNDINDDVATASRIHQTNSTGTKDSGESDYDEEEIFLPSPGTYACSMCSYTAPEKSKMDKHRELHRQNIPIRPCPNESCGYKSTPKALSLHFLECSDLIEPNVELSSVNDIAEVFECNVCPYTSPSKSILKRHLNKFHGIEKELPRQCPYCNFEGTRSVLEQHKSICSFNGNQKQEVPKHTGPKNFQCEYCSFTSFWQYLIEKHTNSHTVLKLPIKQCSRCDFRSTPSALSAHVNSCSKKSKNVLSEASVNGPPKKKFKSSKGAKTDSNEVNSTKNRKQVKRTIAEAHDVISSHDDFDTESEGKPEVASVSNESTLSDHEANHSLVNATCEIKSTLSSSSTGSSPNNTFQCSKCSFSCKLRIVLKVHMTKDH